MGLPLSNALLFPKKKWSRAQVLGPSRPVPEEPGVYAWYFRKIPRRVPRTGCHRSSDGLTLLYVGISPAKPKKGRRPSRQNLRDRLRQHFDGDAECSTLRRSLGCLRGLKLKQRGAKGFTFGPAGELALSAWMAKNAFVCWVPSIDPWLVEHQFIAAHGATLPLNLQGNKANTFRKTLKAIRANAKPRNAAENY